MLRTLRNNVAITRKFFIPQNKQVRSFWEYVNMMFNKPDTDRLKQFGPDRTCAEWVLRNGGRVVWADGTKLADYNSLPPEKQPVKKILEIDGTDSSISHYGFPHLIGCTAIRKIILHNNQYIDDRALKGLSYASSSLNYLQVSKCVNVTDTGLKELKALGNLETLVLFSLASVSDLEGCKQYLTQQLPKCKIEDCGIGMKEK
ncbi:ATP synthase subunit s, mitochondrial isoform X2 [Anticarsia gemmatalis]|uniref:ATP synthase subunit s, mitochondrial isoform X2 n=1 Tax=Anticarsia gemmatalis TaxID=129554 RepID=UPI003F75B9DE